MALGTQNDGGGAIARGLIVPCYNEERRLPLEALRALHRLRPDGSTDGTFGIFERAVAELGADHVTAHRLGANSGKAEAVRIGMQACLARGATIVGYADADFATPPDEILRLLAILEDATGVKVVLGSRVLRLGSDIQRSPVRHILGRVFATLASNAIDVAVYDTQCGAKWFRAGEVLDRALSRPFGSRWVFDVELLARLMGRLGDEPHWEDERFLEVPVQAWRDVSGSKLRLPSMAGSLAELGRLWIKRW
jgi:glycosyltransferase involved in cell wall biosynthesis